MNTQIIDATLSYIFIYINFVCLYLKMSNHNLFKKTFYLKPVIFWFVQKPS